MNSYSIILYATLVKNKDALAYLQFFMIHLLLYSSQYSYIKQLQCFILNGSVHFSSR